MVERGGTRRKGFKALRTVVTGGAGFIGSNLAAALDARGDEVAVLDDLSSGHAANLAPHPRVRLVEGSILEQDALSEILGGADVVFHLAASVGNKRSIDDPLKDAAVNVLGTIGVLEACRHAGVGKIVYSSSAGIFGELKELPIGESHPLEPDSPYGASKLAAEKACLVYAKLYDLEAIALRYFNVYGPNQRFDAYGNAIPIFAFQMLRGERVTIFGDGEQTRDFINVRDVVQANLRAGDSRGISGAFNLGSGTRVSINALVGDLAKLMDEAPDVRFGPPRPGDVRDSLADITKARKGLGFEPAVDLASGLREYVAWARSEVNG
jgi:nucleoside-diphosphate-sugar epimerase